jgi:hypothetical protein
MRSTEKVMEAITFLEDADDQELAEAFPGGIPPGLARAALPFVVDAVPTDADELDTFLTQVGDFCHALRSDGYVPQPA